MDSTENQKASKINELLRNQYHITPIIHGLDFVQYVIGDSIAIIRRKEKDFIKGERISNLKSCLLKACERYQQIIFIIHRTSLCKSHAMGIGTAKKLHRYLQQIALTPRLKLIECIESEQVAETIAYYVRFLSKTNNHNVMGVPINDEIEQIDGTEFILFFMTT